MSDSSAKHIAAARARLTHLHSLSRKTEAAESKIRDAAVARRAAVDSDLERLRPRVNVDPDAADSYQKLTLERGQLDTIIASASAVMAKS